MPKAIWNGQVIAEADAGAMQKVEGNNYFPLSSLKKEFFQDSRTTSKCPWKGTANYFTVVVDGKTDQGSCRVLERRYRRAVIGA
jgi:uncharacterized protein (DUF427 family)